MPPRWRRRFYGPKGRVPLKPFAGTIGVAPAEPGVHSVVPPRRVGGNLDIRDLAAGTTLYLPVEVEGALFSIGDTHAAQGDGEVCGTAIESQMDVELTLDLVKGANLKSPRFTTPGPVTRHLDGAGYEATTGVGPDLMTAARESVMRMIDLLAAEHGLSPVDAYMLLSVCGDLRISEIVDSRTGSCRSTSRASSFRDALAAPPILAVEDLCDRRPHAGGVAAGARGRRASRSRRGETLCLAGESGSGKSLTALAIMRLLSPSLRQRSGSIRLDGPRADHPAGARDARSCAAATSP